MDAQRTVVIRSVVIRYNVFTSNDLTHDLKSKVGNEIKEHVDDVLWDLVKNRIKWSLKSDFSE